MKRYVLLVLSVLFCLMIPGTLLAASLESVTFYPNTAQLSEYGKFPVSSAPGGMGQTTLMLPQQADPQSLTLTAMGIGIVDTTAKLVQASESADVKALRKRLDAAIQDKNAAITKAHSLRARIDYWETATPSQNSSAKGAALLAKAIGDNLDMLYPQFLTAEADLNEKKAVADLLQKQFDAATGKDAKAWSITVLLDSDNHKSVNLKYDYRVSGCGWTPVYRLDARPKESVVKLALDARIRQSLGRALTGTIYLSTLPPSGPTRPPHLPEWVIRPRSVFTQGKAMNDAQPEMAVTQAMPRAKAMAAPKKTRKSTFILWDIGQRTIHPGPEQRVSIKKTSLKADFTYLLRPSRSKLAFLRAEATATTPQDMPDGQALYLVDGSVIGKRPFSFMGTEKTLYFGTDPLVSAEVENLERASGESGFIATQRTQNWKWRVTVDNQKPYAVKTRIEEPAPKVYDKRIKVTVTHTPDPSETKDNMLIWDETVPASSKKIIEWGVSLEAPEDMELDLGWR